ncbi:PTS system IIB component, L-Asc family (TC 4.A.7) [Propionispira arboris]|uniref:PTS system IIB component, L-Asc family (TC 4.A.7) n=1 Tax=Propionispira arboris TaxID=84035 RepID=A0A1H6WUS4_9FIRM|nr:MULTISPECIES: PTS sugar transporter subunit IIB [Propionispira]SEJ19616.1 PTS system IIB component, L-Asc family (TC 4.A.7) [Propionispira arboris]
MKILTVCGNGIGSSLMLAMKIEEICKEEGIQADVESIDFNSAQGKDVDLIVTVKELAEQFEHKDVAVVRSYINKKKIKEDILEIIRAKANQ